MRRLPLTVQLLTPGIKLNPLLVKETWKSPTRVCPSRAHSFARFPGGNPVKRTERRKKHKADGKCAYVQTAKEGRALVSTTKQPVCLLHRAGKKVHCTGTVHKLSLQHGSGTVRNETNQSKMQLPRGRKNVSASFLRL